jgi:DNA repair protein RecO (recombination protein O)
VPRVEATQVGGHRERGAREFSDLGIVLRSHKLGESDKILRILTREHGKRSAVAKGVRKTTSRFGARLEPLTCASLFMHRGRSMDTIKQVEIRTSFREVREDLDLFVSAQAMAELIDKIANEHEPHPELFDLFLTGLELLRDYPRRAAFTRAFFEFKVMSRSGFELMVARCANCSEKLGERDASFSLHLGGIICESCRAGRAPEAGKLVRVGIGTAGMLSWMATHELGEWPAEPPSASMREAGMLMDMVLEHWMEREFRSHRVMKAMPGGAEGKASGR